MSGFFNRTRPQGETACAIVCGILLLAVVPGARAAADGVVVGVDKPRYGTSDIITVAVANRGATAISTAALQSFCTVVLLERRTATGWNPLNSCPQVRRPRTIVLDPGAELVVTLPGPGRPIGTALRPGTYRAAVAYMPGKVVFEGRLPPGARVSYSPLFVIR